MFIKDRVAKSTTNDAQRSLFTEIKGLVENTLTAFYNVYIDADKNKYSRYIEISENFESTYKTLNLRFRNIFCGKSENITTVNLYYKTYNKKTYYNEVMTAHPEYETVIVNRYFPKFTYSMNVLWDLYRENLILLYAKEGNKVNYLQIIVSFVKVAIECFRLQEINWYEVVDLFKQVMNDFDDIEFNDLVIKYGSKPIRTRKSGLKYNSKCSNLDYVVKDLIDSGMKKTAICKELGIGRTALYNLMKNSFLFN